MSEPRLDPAISLDATIAPTFNNVSIVAESSGRRRTQENWGRDLRVFTIQFVVRWKHNNPSNQENVQKFRDLLAFFRNRRGSSRSFRMKDWTDFDDWGSGRVALVNGVYRLVKDYDSGLDVFTLPIYKPVEGTITLAGGAASGTLDYTTGIVSPVSGSPDLSGTWTGEYDCWVHFLSDSMEYKADPSGIVYWQGVKLMEDVVDDV